jgi:hypothetical protein
MGMLKYPMIAAVNRRGTRLGIKEINTIWPDLNNTAISSATKRIAIMRLIAKLETIYADPLVKATAVPVRLVVYFEEGKIVSISASTLFTSARICTVPISATLEEILVFLNVESIKECSWFPVLY